jgi:hypothetical protein
MMHRRLRRPLGIVGPVLLLGSTLGRPPEPDAQ